MKILKTGFCAIFAAAFICTILGGCANLPLKEDGLEIGKDTTAGIDDIGVGPEAGGVGRITRQF